MKQPGFYIAEEDVADHSDILHGEPYATREEAEVELQKLLDMPECEIAYYVTEVKENTNA